MFCLYLCRKMSSNSKNQLSQDENKAPEDVFQQQKNLDENSTKLEEIRNQYESKLKQLYSMKAEETILELNFESWKQLYRKQEAELTVTLDRVKSSRQSIWDDREQLCALSGEFAKESSMENFLREMNRATETEDVSSKAGALVVVEMRNESSLLALELDEVELEIEKANEREEELNRMEQEQMPEEETIRRLQETVTSSVHYIEEMEEEIRSIKANSEEVVYNQESEVKSILKKTTFVTYDAGKKQVHFE
ncbi:golgin subfamily A member 6-like protein 26 [Toxorhynchites rutilus septentrionalis]|uniref:golgin subfamily A member 6-like protein 26 n=1 Tax=Toxorhynchites rutilus septentrionalis TaxID=329112 RepID=UPI002478A2F3|nr:golgin subfamily A member 6-like protein 26 [Toxorhynchites rutilus septentrionalis]